MGGQQTLKPPHGLAVSNCSLKPLSLIQQISVINYNLTPLCKLILASSDSQIKYCLSPPSLLKPPQFHDADLFSNTQNTTLARRGSNLHRQQEEQGLRQNEGGQGIGPIKSLKEYRYYKYIQQNPPIMDLPPKIVEMLEILSQDHSHLKAIRTAKKLYNIDENELKVLTPQCVFQLLRKTEGPTEPPAFTAPPQLTPHPYQQDHWQPNEFKLFCWVAVCYSSLAGRELSRFTRQDISLLQNVFSKKNQLFIEYHLLTLLRPTRSRKQIWQQEEVQLLLALLSEDSLAGRWSDISYALFCRSAKRFFRTSHKCREKWFNHLNPTVNHDKWSPQEDCELFALAGKLGTKWAKISKAMQGKRTQHMVKNRYNSLSKKYHSRFQRCSTKKMIENIGKYLQTKLSTKREEAEDIIIPIEPTAACQPAPVVEVKKEEDYPSSKTIVTEGEECACKSEYNIDYEAKTNQKLVKAEELDYVNDYEDVLDWQFMYKQRNIELIDYISMEFQYNKTIFNCE